jgi:outer membrane protein assembly factor BamD
MRYLLLLLLLSVSLSACSKPVVPETHDAGYYFAEGETFFDKGLYDDAVASWQKARESYYSPELNIIVELKIAEANFLSEKYLEAAAAYEDFLKQHPNNDRVPDALYLLGLSYFKQILPPDRDQTATNNAMVTFADLLKRFPRDPRSEEVKLLISRCRDVLAGHEVYVGRFYLRTGHYAAAISRIEGMFASYPKYFRSDEAWFYLGQAYLKTGEKTKAIKAFNTIFNDFPGSPYTSEAHEMLEKSS